MNIRLMCIHKKRNDLFHTTYISFSGGMCLVDLVDINLQGRGNFLCIILSIVYVDVLT